MQKVGKVHACDATIDEVPKTIDLQLKVSDNRVDPRFDLGLHLLPSSDVPREKAERERTNERTVCTHFTHESVRHLAERERASQLKQNMPSAGFGAEKQ